MDCFVASAPRNDGGRSSRGGFATRASARLHGLVDAESADGMDQGEFSRRRSRRARSGPPDHRIARLERILEWFARHLA